jgi:hypothetical protein
MVERLIEGDETLSILSAAKRTNAVWSDRHYPRGHGRK